MAAQHVVHQRRVALVGDVQHVHLGQRQQIGHGPADILGLAGLEVITAQDGVAGLRYFQRHHDEVALVLLDLTMPKMDGEETFQRLRRLNPDVKVVLSTGFGDLSAKERLVHGGVNGFLQKPYDAQALLECIQAVLENRRPPSTIGSA